LEPPAAELERAVGEFGFAGTLIAGRFLERLICNQATELRRSGWLDRQIQL
jgi:hypothetical protein